MSSTYALARRPASTRATRPPARLLHIGDGSGSPSHVKSFRRTRTMKRALLKVAPALFPGLDDTTAAVVISYMPSRDFGASTLVSKAWLALNSDESFWRPFLATVDPMSSLGEERLNRLAARFSCKKVVTELSSRLCSLCREATNGFFVLTCSRVCLSCFETDKLVKMCSLSFAKKHYLLSKAQADKLPTIYADKAKETGCVFSKDAGITVTLCSSAKASAVSRWGSDEAFEAEMGARKARAEASYEARKRAYLSQDRPHTSPTSTAAPEGKPGASEGSEGAGDGYNWPPFARRKPYPARSRLLHLSRETNYVGVNQQQYHSVRGEKYGFFTVVNEAFFDSGPTVVITETTIDFDSESSDEEGRMELCGWCGQCLYCVGPSHRESRHNRVRRARGSKLTEALREATPGTTINIATSVVLPHRLSIKTSVRLLSTEHGELEMWDGALVITAPSIVRDLRVNRLPNGGDPSEGLDVYPGIVGPAVTVQDDVLIEECKFGPCPVGHAVALQLGRLVARSNTFTQTTFGLAVRPFTNCDHLTTTVHLEGNVFDTCWVWGIMKGPARCHPQDNGAILAANMFSGFSASERICEYLN